MKSEYANNSLVFLGTGPDQQNRPLITVVTVVFNSEEFLERTIQSVIGQTYDNIEYIIIDGGSTDGTLDIIRKYEDKVSCWVSEQDNGIYDAMNKGIKIARGEWISFMNAGDIFNSSDTVWNVFSFKKYDEDILYGNTNIVYHEFSRICISGSHYHLCRGMQFCHQSIFVRSYHHKLNMFNCKNLIAADFQFCYESYKKNIKFRYIDSVISTVLSGGVSDCDRAKTIDAWRDVVCGTRRAFPARIYFFFLKMNVILRSKLKQILSEKIINFIIMNKK